MTFILMLALVMTGMATASAVMAYSTIQKDAQTTSTIALGSGTEYLSPELWGLMYKQLAGETVLERVRVLIVPNLVSVTPSLSDYITTAGGTSEGSMLWEVPSSSLQGIVQRGDVARMWLQTTRTTRDVSTDPYPALGLNDILDDVVEANVAGVPAEQAALYAFFVKNGRILVKVTAPDTATETAIRTWLTSRSIFLHPQTQSGARNTLYINVVLPVGQVLPLAQAHPSAILRAEPRPSPRLTLSRSN